MAETLVAMPIPVPVPVPVPVLVLVDRPCLAGRQMRANQAAAVVAG